MGMYWYVYHQFVLHCFGCTNKAKHFLSRWQLFFGDQYPSTGALGWDMLALCHVDLWTAVLSLFIQYRKTMPPSIKAAMILAWTSIVCRYGSWSNPEPLLNIQWMTRIVFVRMFTYLSSFFGWLVLTDRRIDLCDSYIIHTLLHNIWYFMCFVIMFANNACTMACCT